MGEKAPQTPNYEPLANTRILEQKHSRMLVPQRIVPKDCATKSMGLVRGPSVRTTAARWEETRYNSATVYC